MLAMNFPERGTEYEQHQHLALMLKPYVHDYICMFEFLALHLRAGPNCLRCLLA